MFHIGSIMCLPKLSSYFSKRFLSSPINNENILDGYFVLPPQPDGKID